MHALKLPERFKSTQVHALSSSSETNGGGRGKIKAIEELERMTREPSDVVEEMNDRLSAGRDSWCALEVFEWLRKENRVDEETMELMVGIMCGWVKKLIQEKHGVGDVVDLLVDMDCVGLRPGFSMIEKVICLYREMGEKKVLLLFVEEVLRRGISCVGDDPEGHQGGPAGYLAWKMMVEGDYRGAVRLVIRFREAGLKPEIYSYLVAMTAAVKELNEFAKALRKLKSFARTGLIAKLDAEDVELAEKCQSELLADGARLSNWVIRDGTPSLHGVIHERLLAMYICEAKRQLWEMKLVGKEADGDLYNIVLAICASQKEAAATPRLLTQMEVASSPQKKRSLS